MEAQWAVVASEDPGGSLLVGLMFSSFWQPQAKMATTAIIVKRIFFMINDFKLFKV